MHSCLDGEDGTEESGLEGVGSGVVGACSEIELGGGCDKMLCSHPWMVAPLGVGEKIRLLSREAKEAMTPRPCGQCLPCRINKARIWAQRIMLEGMVTQPTIFITLTYNDDHLPPDNSLRPKDTQDFFKLLRYYLGSTKVRYFLVGEYGAKSDRPHYHAILFGIGPDKEEQIAKSWPHGFIHVGFLTEQSARYVTGYVVKGMTKKDHEWLKGRHPEFMRCSKMSPGGLGVGAVNQVVASIKESGVNVGGLVRKIKKGKKSLPLGRYLTDKLKAAIPGQSEISHRAYADWQDEFFSHYGQGVYVDQVVGSRSAERDRNINRHNFFKRRTTV